METRATHMTAMASSTARLTANGLLSGGCHRLALTIDEPFAAPAPGQFCMLSLDDPGFPLLPRPFSVLGCSDDGGQLVIEFMIMPVGRGSGLLCSLPLGAQLQVVGPMGHALDDADGACSSEPGLAPLGTGPVVCVAGGYGVAPFLFLAESWAQAHDPRHKNLTVIFGARTAERLTLSDRLEASGVRVELCTEDGSTGFAGRVDGRLAELIETQRPAVVLSCGPEPMMEAVGAVSRAAGITSVASLETVMGCGYAVCNGCAVAVDSDSEADGYTYELACREGTLFDTTLLHWNRL
ncbi:MAG: dihydroorotate dehydrogenase electron transfer subunit [Pseudohongiellaceae bacterium]|jgi:dihydroorotate dehydrogenase electron transfer subunit